MIKRNSKGQFIKGNFPINPFTGKERIGKKNSNYQKERISLALKGKKLSKEHKEKLRNRKYGKRPNKK